MNFIQLGIVGGLGILAIVIVIYLFYPELIISTPTVSAVAAVSSSGFTPAATITEESVKQYLISSDEEGNLLNTTLDCTNNNLEVKGGLTTNNKYFQTLDKFGMSIGTDDTNKTNNKWIFHAPLDNKKTLSIAPTKDNSLEWDWTKQFAINNDGGVFSRKFFVNSGPSDRSDFNTWRGANFYRTDGRWTHFDWKENGNNYIRGTTYIDGDLCINGICINGEHLKMLTGQRAMYFCNEASGNGIDNWQGKGANDYYGIRATSGCTTGNGYHKWYLRL
jgi:hypothetical protein